jgi:p-methyltransferase
MKILLLSQEEPHPFYAGVHEYFTAPLLSGDPLPLEKLSVPPLGITLLASALNERGFEAKPFHNYFSSEKEKTRLLAELARRPFAVCVSTTHLFSPALMEATNALVQSLSPGTFVIAGGPGAQWNPELRPRGGVTVAGPAEDSLPELLSALAERRNPRTVPDLIFSLDGNWTQTPRSEPPPLDSLPLPDWGLYPRIPEKVPVQGSRGCARACGFCSYSAPYSSRSPASVLREVRANRNRWGIKRFRFTDSDFACDPDRAFEICRGLEADGGLGWTCFARADGLLAEGLPEAMRRAGCLWVFLGLESGSEKILDLMNKGCGPDVMRAGIAAAKKAGLGVHGNFVVGYPGETLETLAQTEAFAKGSGLDTAYFSPFQIRSPGIPALAAKQQGLSGGAAGWAHSTMTSEEMLEYTKALMARVAADPSAPLLTSEALFSLFSEGEGPAFAASVRSFFGAVRDWNLGRAAGDAGRQAEARKRLAAHL